jgi:hypothetical protein
MVTLLPIPIMNCNILQKQLEEQPQTNREVLNDVPQRILQSFTVKQHPSDESGYFNVLCADGNYRHFKPVLSAWLADCPEYSDLHHLERHVCLWCDCSKNDLADYVHPVKQHHLRDYNLYRMLSDANSKAADAEISWRHVHRGFNVFQPILCIVNELRNPHFLYTMPIGMLDHLQN